VTSFHFLQMNIAVISTRTESKMPWTGPAFAKKHNHSLNKSEANSAAHQATAMINSGVDEGIAIATANKRINKLRKSGKISDRQAGKFGM
jgi:uncharacterized protein YdaT